MQDEIIKHTQNIRKSIGNSSHTTAEKLKEVLIEIFIIVFAVTLSIWLHSWSEHKHEQNEAQKFLTELKSDIQRDIELLKQNKQLSVRLDSNYKFVLSLGDTPMTDTVLGSYTDMYNFSTNFNTGRYEGFKSGGKIGTIENDSLKNNILVYYQQTIPNLIAEANFLNSEQMKILNAGQDAMDKSSLYQFLTTKKTHSMYYFLEYNFRASITDYENTITQANNIIKQINELSEK